MKETPYQRPGDKRKLFFLLARLLIKVLPRVGYTSKILKKKDNLALLVSGVF